MNALTLSLTVNATVERTSCTPGGAGGEVDFTGNPRSPTKCTPGPIENLVPGQTRTILLAPTGVEAAAPSRAHSVEICSFIIKIDPADNRRARLYSHYTVKRGWRPSRAFYFVLLGAPSTYCTLPLPLWVTER